MIKKICDEIDVTPEELTINFDENLFNVLFPIGSVIYSIHKDIKFSHGEWECIGSNVFTYFFVRIK